jgi:hypothetical protein
MPTGIRHTVTLASGEAVVPPQGESLNTDLPRLEAWFARRSVLQGDR